MEFGLKISPKKKKFISTAFFATKCLSLVIRMSLKRHSQCREGASHMGDLFSAFRGTKEGLSVLALMLFTE